MLMKGSGPEALFSCVTQALGPSSPASLTEWAPCCLPFIHFPGSVQGEKQSTLCVRPLKTADERDCC